MIRGILLGSLVLHPSSSSSSEIITQTLLIKNTGGAGERVVDMSVRTRPRSKKKTNPETEGRTGDIEEELELESETLKTLSIPCVDPLKISYDVKYRRWSAHSSGGSPGLWDTSDSNSLEHEAVVRTTIECLGPWGVEIEKVVLVRRPLVEVSYYDLRYEGCLR